MTKAPISLQDLRRSLYVKAKAEPSWRFWGLYVHVCKMETLREAYLRSTADERKTWYYNWLLTSGDARELCGRPSLELGLSSILEDLRVRSSPRCPESVVSVRRRRRR